MPRREYGSAELLHALAAVNRVRATIGYNAAMVALAVGIGALISPRGSVVAGLIPAGLYATGGVLLKLHASVADAIHDRGVDAANPEKSTIAIAVSVIGVESAWTILMVELVVGMTVVGAAAILAKNWLLPAGAAIAVFGFTYSFPPRTKERGIWNHVVTTGVDVGLVVLPVAAVVGDGLTPKAAIVVTVVWCYSFGYHVMHQAADVHYDRLSGLQTFATDLGIEHAIAVAAVATATAAGLALALGYPLAALATGAVTAYYVVLCRAVVDSSPREACRLLSESFSIAWVASLLNGVLAAAVWYRALDGPKVLPTPVG